MYEYIYEWQQRTQLIRITSSMEECVCEIRGCMLACVCGLILASCILHPGILASCCKSNNSRTSANDLINHRVRQRNIWDICSWSGSGSGIWDTGSVVHGPWSGGALTAARKRPMVSTMPRS